MSHAGSLLKRKGGHDVNKRFLVIMINKYKCVLFYPPDLPSVPSHTGPASVSAPTNISSAMTRAEGERDNIAS